MKTSAGSLAPGCPDPWLSTVSRAYINFRRLKQTPSCPRGSSFWTVYCQVTTLQRAPMTISQPSDMRPQRPETGSDTPRFGCEQHGRGCIGSAAVVLMKKETQCCCAFARNLGVGHHALGGQTGGEEVSLMQSICLLSEPRPWTGHLTLQLSGITALLSQQLAGQRHFLGECENATFRWG
jgi:hypothetical protein